MKRKYDLTKGSILKALLIVALPTLGTSLIQMAYNLTDMFWVARVDQLGLVPEEAVSAIGTVGFYPWLGFGLILLAKIGTSVKVSQAAGMNDMKLVEKIGNNGLILMFVLGLAYSLFGYFGAHLFVGWFNTGNANIDAYAITYMQIVTSFGLSFFLVNLFNGVYDGLGKTINTLLVTSSGLILNIILDPIFILDKINLFNLVTIDGLGMGVKGAAIATVIGQTSILIIYIGIYLSKYRPFRINIVKYFDWQVLKEISRIGIFVGIQSMLFTFISMIIARMVLSYGEAPMAIQRVGSQIESVAWMIASGFQVALASFVGQNFGARKYERIKEGYKTSMKLLVPYGIVINILLFVFAEQIFSVFFSNPETLRIGKIYLEILSISQLFMIVELATAGVFNGLGKTFYPSVVSISGNLIRIPGAILLGASLGYSGIWMSVSVSSIIKGTILVIWILYFLKRLGKPDGILFENKL
jgi:putative MATE family efflux protein